MKTVIQPDRLVKATCEQANCNKKPWIFIQHADYGLLPLFLCKTHWTNLTKKGGY